MPLSCFFSLSLRVLSVFVLLFLSASYPVSFLLLMITFTVSVVPPVLIDHLNYCLIQYYYLKWLKTSLSVFIRSRLPPKSASLQQSVSIITTFLPFPFYSLSLRTRYVEFYFSATLPTSSLCHFKLHVQCF